MGLKEEDTLTLRDMRVLQHLFVERYRGVLHNCESHQVWANDMFDALTKYAKLFMQYELMGDAYHMIFPFFEHFSTNFKLNDQHRQIYHYPVTYKDLYSLCVDFKALWGKSRELSIPYDTAEMEAALVHVKGYLWKQCRLTYYKLKYHGIETMDYDVVFQNKECPFSDVAMYALLGSYSAESGWLPLGHVFSDKYPLIDNLQNLGSHVRRTGVTTRWQDLMCLAGQLFPLELRSGHVIYELPALDEKDVKKYQDKTGLGLKSCQILSQEINHHEIFYESLFQMLEEFGKEKTMSIWDFSQLDEEELGEVQTPLYTFEELKKLFMSVAKLKNAGKVLTMTDEWLQGEIEKMQKTREFFIFKRFLHTKRAIGVRGLFVEACVQYADRLDPVIEHSEANWTKFRVIQTHQKVVMVNDKKLFVSEIAETDGNMVFMDYTYHVTGQGKICYGYNLAGEPLVVDAYYCEHLDTSLLSLAVYKDIQNVIYRDKDWLIQLPKLTVVGEKVVWRGYELTNVDLTYWHEQLGHLSLKGLKKYVDLVQGMPPYFWPKRIECTQCS